MKFPLSNPWQRQLALKPETNGAWCGGHAYNL